MWIGIGLAICAVFLRGLDRARWLVVTVPLGIAGEIVLTQIYH